MSNAVQDTPTTEATENVVSAGGVPHRKWFAAVVKRNTEKACREKLQELGYESYVATQEETRVWRNGERRKVERVIISTIIFVRATEQERIHTLKLGFINRYLTNKALPANDLGRHPIATIPDNQMQQLQFMLYNADAPVNFADMPLRLGDRVRITRGSLTGLEGNIIRNASTHYIVVNIDFLGSAMVNISLGDIERIV